MGTQSRHLDIAKIFCSLYLLLTQQATRIRISDMFRSTRNRSCNRIFDCAPFAQVQSMTYCFNGFYRCLFKTVKVNNDQLISSENSRRKRQTFGSVLKSFTKELVQFWLIPIPQGITPEHRHPHFTVGKESLRRFAHQPDI